MNKRLISMLLSVLMIFSIVMPAAGAAPTDVLLDRNLLTKAEAKQWKEILAQREEKLAAEPLLDQRLEGLGGESTRVIVELSNKPVAVAQGESTLSGKSFTSSMETNAVTKVEQQQQSFVHSLTQNKINHEVLENYAYALNGVAIEVDGNQMGQLLRIPGVVSVYPDLEITLAPENDEVNPYMKDTAPFIGAPEVWDLGYKGEGIKVGVIDTGIDYEHPNLKDAYKGGWDFVENDDDPYETTREEWKVSEQPEFNANGSSYYTSHGTHVAGTIAAREAGDYGVVGIAPEADIYAYRVLGAYGSGQTSWVLGGIDRSVKDGMDVINLSLGNDANDPSYITSVALNNAMLSGVTAVVASGNEGPNRYTLGSPGASAMAITVGNSTGPSQIITANTHFWIGEDGEGTLPEEQPVPEVEQLPELGIAPETEAPEIPEQGVPVTNPDDSSADAPEADVISEESASPGEGALPVEEQAEAETVTSQDATDPSTEEVTPVEEEETVAPTVTQPNPLTVTESVYRLDVMGWNLSADPEDVLTGQYELEFAGLGKPTDFEGKDFAGKVAFVQRGELAFVEKVANAKAAGAVAVIVYNNLPGPIGLSLGDNFELIPTLSMSKEDGEGIKAQLDAGELVEVSFSDFVHDQTPGDDMYDSSSRGPAKVTLDIKPDVVAPGTSILSTIPAYGKDEPGADYAQAYDRKTGTSMATPHVAGLIALLIEKHPDWTPFDIKVALMNNTKVLDTALYDVFDQGAGRIQALETIDPETFVKVMDVTKYTESGEAVEKENITGSVNFGNFLSTDEKTVSKTLKVQSLKGVGGEYSVTVNPTRSVNGVSVSMDKTSFALNGEEEVQVTITVPKGVTTVGEAQGYLQFSHEAKTYSVPYVAHFNLTESGIKYIETKYGNETNPFHYPLNADGTLDTLDVFMEFHNPMNFALIEIFDGLNPDGGFYQDGYIGSIYGANYTFNANARYKLAWDGQYVDYTTEQETAIPDGLYTVDITSRGTDGKTYREDTPPFLVKTEAPVVKVPETLEIQQMGKDSLMGTVEDLYITVAPALKSGWDYDLDVTKSLKSGYTVKDSTDKKIKEGSFEVESDGSFRISLGELPAGKYSVEFAIEDLQGLVGTSSTSLTVKKDPDPQVPKPSTPSPGSGSGSSGGSSSASSPTPAPASTVIGDASLSEKKNADGTIQATAALSETVINTQLLGDGQEVKLDVSGIEFEKYSQVELTLSKSIADKLQAAGKNLIIEGQTFNVSIPATSLTDFITSNGFSLKLHVLDEQAEKQNVNIVSKIVSIDHNAETFKHNISLTLKYDAKSVKDPRKVIAYHQTTEDAWQPASLSNVSQKGQLEFSVTEPGAYAVVENDVTFGDITGHWAKDEIEVIASQQIAKGMSASVFSPNSTISHAEFATLLDRIFGTGIDWETRSKEAGAQDQLTREKMVMMIADALELEQGPTSISFKDGDQISDEAKSAVAFAVENGLVKGMSGNQFAPKATSTRAQVSVILYRLLEHLDKI
ncbi:S8 family serine peptidase [Paenibacillus xylanilyticus]|uniref:S8 family serine peptidase n=1 Tax=Paenibacillus xylanilyticus TaxID=248903 RepID=A0A7Y6BTE3_9BACL|nr:S8 family serine peptidase [Paenibacillus xylanilyticus]NUU74504.1 S8 family serine peptidase [Paenibacillus xylanilyticus]